MSLYEDSTRRPERTRAREQRAGCRPVPTGLTATTSRVTTTERRARRARVQAVRRRRRLVVVACLGIVAALIGRLAVTGGREAHAVSSRAAVTARARAAEPVLPGPFHGYLLIADRGNNWMLLVDGAQRVCWGYPRRSRGRNAVSVRRLQHVLRAAVRSDHLQPGGPGHDPDHRRSPAGTHPLALRPREREGRRARLPEHARRRVPASERPRLGGRRVQLPRALHRRSRTGSCVSTARPGVCRHDPPRYLGAVNGATPLADGGTLVSEITGSWIDDIGPTGRLRWAVQAPVSYPVRPAAPRAGPDPARRLREARATVIIMTRAGQRALALRPGARARRARTTRRSRR